MTDPFSYAGKRVVVTGAATGVGAALLDVLAEQDVTQVTVLDIKAPTGPHDVFVETDLGHESSVDAAIAAIAGPVDVLFNNAGVADTMPAATVIAVNFLAVRKLSEALLDRIPEGGADREHRINGRRTVADARARAHRDPRTRWLGHRARPRRSRARGARSPAVLPLEGTRAALHPAILTPDDPAGRPHQRGLPVTDRHAAPRRLPDHDGRCLD
jgi:Short-chain dehydrogenases of various substrate specificities